MTISYTPIYSLYRQSQTRRHLPRLNQQELEQKKNKILERVEKAEQKLQAFHRFQQNLESDREELCCKQKQALSTEEQLELSEIQTLLSQLEEKATKWQNHLDWLQARLAKTERQLAQYQQHLRARSFSP